MLNKQTFCLSIEGAFYRKNILLYIMERRKRGWIQSLHVLQVKMSTPCNFMPLMQILKAFAGQGLGKNAIRVWLIMCDMSADRNSALILRFWKYPGDESDESVVIVWRTSCLGSHRALEKKTAKKFPPSQFFCLSNTYRAFN